MTNRENAMAILGYGRHERVPVLHFGFWPETVDKWHREGRLSDDDIEGMGDLYFTETEARIGRKAGFDFGWLESVRSEYRLHPAFTREVLEEFPDGSRHVLNADGVVILEKPGVVSIPMEIDHMLKGRAEWEEHFKPKLRFTADRVDAKGIERVRKGENGDMPIGVYCGSLFGQIRDMLGVEGMSYLYVDDEALYVEIVDTVGELCYLTLEATLDAAAGMVFDFGHYWEDICFKNGPLVVPRVFNELVGPHYRRMTELLAKRGTRVVSLDCDGCIDALVPTWLENGVNAMFPIEVGTWGASIAPWRAKYGRRILGVGGMDKTVFSREKADIDAEIERMKPLVDMGGYLPCPDHRIAPDAKWDNVRYYCDSMRKAFG